MKISRMVFELEPFKDFILASKVKIDLGGQRSLLKKVEQFNEKQCWKGLKDLYIYRMVYKLDPYTDFISASKVKVDLRGQGSFLKKFW